MIGPDSEEVGEGRPRGCDGDADPAMRFLELSVEALHVGEQLDGQVVAGLLDRGRRLDALEERNGVRSVEFLGDSARRELHHHVVKPAHDPGPMVADIDVALGQQPQHLGMVSGHDLPQRGCTQRGDRHRQGIVRSRSCPSGPCRAPGSATPGSPAHPRRSRRHRRAAAPAGSQARQRTRSPSPRAERLRPAQQLRDLLAGRPHLARPSSASLRSIATAVWLALCGSTPMITVMSTSVVSTVGNREGTPASDRLCTFLFRATPRRGPRRAALRSKANRATPAAGTSLATPTETSKRYERTAALIRVSSRHLGDGRF